MYDLHLQRMARCFEQGDEIINLERVVVCDYVVLICVCVFCVVI